MILLGVTNLAAESRLRLQGDWSRSADKHAPSEAGRLARALLRYVATDSGKFPAAADWAFSRSSSGQPQVSAAGSPDLRISFSHSRDWVACALSTAGPIGIDIEIHRPGRSLRDIAELSFGPGERRRCQDEETEFYRIWTIREAIAKATGIGLAQVTDRRDYADTGPMLGTWRTAIAADTWDITCMLPAPGLSLACATTASAAAPPEQPALRVVT